MGKKKIAQILARAGLHLGVTTVRRMLKTRDQPPEPREQTPAEEKDPESDHTVTAKHPNHVWHVDLTVVPTSAGFWVPWFPFTLLQVWPFCWWVATVLDHYSRKVIGVAVFKQQPSSVQVRQFLALAVRAARQAPRHLISDKGSQFWNDGFKRWCKRRKIRPRFGAVGRYGSIAVIERFTRSLKEEHCRRIPIPLRLADMRKSLATYLDWFNGQRPHEALAGRTPDEVYFNQPPANAQPRFEPRDRWPPGSRCAGTQTAVREGEPAVKLLLVVTTPAGQQHLPRVGLQAA
jgi:putative transposase